MAPNITTRSRNRGNPFTGLPKAFRAVARIALQDVARQICEDEAKKLEADGHVDTGELIDSIHHSKATFRDNVVSIYGYVDAKAPTNGARYAEFIEHGTGEFRDDGDGTTDVRVYSRPYSAWKRGELTHDEMEQNMEYRWVQGWIYKDRHGNWHTTRGMAADPFIDPALKNAVPLLEETFGINMAGVFDHVKGTYGGNPHWCIFHIGTDDKKYGRMLKTKEIVYDWDKAVRQQAGTIRTDNYERG